MDEKEMNIIEAHKKKDATVRITVEIVPTGEKSRVKPHQRVHEFHVAFEDLPIKVSAHSARLIQIPATLIEEMEED